MGVSGGSGESLSPGRPSGLLEHQTSLHRQDAKNAKENLPVRLFLAFLAFLAVKVLRRLERRLNDGKAIDAKEHEGHEGVAEQSPCPPCLRGDNHPPLP